MVFTYTVKCVITMLQGGNCGCGWTNRYLKDEQPLLEDIAMEELIQELSSRLFHFTPDEFEDVLDELRRNYVRD